jgi:hypothetical protein
MKSVHLHAAMYYCTLVSGSAAMWGRQFCLQPPFRRLLGLVGQAILSPARSTLQ